MKFKSLPITSLEDATVDFEQLGTLDILNKTSKNFLQLAGVPATVKLSWGVFATGTGSVANAGSGDWSLSGLGVGSATINYPARAVIPAVLLTVYTAAGFNGYAEAVTVSTTQAVIGTINQVGPAGINAAVGFAVIG